jgi:hypothetical protein
MEEEEYKIPLVDGNNYPDWKFRMTYPISVRVRFSKTYSDSSKAVIGGKTGIREWASPE